MARRHRDRAADIDRSMAWWEKRLARGVCAVCTLPLPEDFAPKTPIHRECARLTDRGYTYQEVRAMPPGERTERSTHPVPGRRSYFRRAGGS
jgi:hypothetical protein